MQNIEIDTFIQWLEERNPNEPEFIQISKPSPT